MAKERVALVKVREQRLDEAVARAVDLLGGLGDIVPRGSRVMVKPNLVFAPTDRGIAHPELVEAIVRLVAEASPKEILIAEGSADTYTSEGFRFQGMGRIAARYGAEVVDLNLEEGVKTPVPSDLGRDYIMLPKAVVESDVFISVPVFKLWGRNPVSFALKNLIGLYGGRYYGYNKDSRQRGDDPGYGLLGEVGTELGAHQPRVPQSVCALNSVVQTHLTIIDALEGGDGRGNFMRLDTLIAGRNPVATDAIGCTMIGIPPNEYEILRLCAERGLGPANLDEIEIVGENLKDVSFDLRRLHNNVLEMPLGFCLNLLTTGELGLIQRALHLHGLLEQSETEEESRETLLAVLGDTIGANDYFERAVAQCTDYARELLRIIAGCGGTSGSIIGVREAFEQRFKGLYYPPSHRALTRLGLAYAVDSRTRPYYLLPEGIIRVLR